MVYELTDVDKRIIHFLIINGANFSCNEMSEKLRISGTTVSYKMKKLEEEGVIRGYPLRLNPIKVGFERMAWLFIYLSKHVEVRKVSEQLLKHPSIYNVSLMGGDIDLICKVFFKSDKDLNDMITWIGQNLREEVTKISVALVTDIHKLHQVYPFDSEPYDLDDDERKILNCMSSDPNIPISRMAKSLGFHRNTIAAKSKFFWKKKILLKRGVTLNPSYFEECGVGFKAIVLIETVPGEHRQAVEDLVSLDEIHELTSIAYHDNLLAVVRTKDLYNFYQFIQKLYREEHVAHTNTNVIFVSTSKKLHA